MLEALASQQAGVVSRQQALLCGLTDATIAAHIDARRWRRVLRGVYAVTTGSLSRLSVLWAVLLRLGQSATPSHETAAELWGLLDRRPTRSV